MELCQVVGFWQDNVKAFKYADGKFEGPFVLCQNGTDYRVETLREEVGLDVPHTPICVEVIGLTWDAGWVSREKGSLICSELNRLWREGLISFDKETREQRFTGNSGDISGRNIRIPRR